MSRPGDIGNFDSRTFLVWEEKEDKVTGSHYHDALGIIFWYYVTPDIANKYFNVTMHDTKGKAGLDLGIDFINVKQAKRFAQWHNELFIGDKPDPQPPCIR